MTKTTVPKSWRRHRLEVLAWALDAEFEAGRARAEGLRAAFVEREVAPGSAVNVDGTATALEMITETTTFELEATDGEVRSVVKELMDAARSDLDERLVTALRGSLADGPAQGPDWRTAVDHAMTLADRADLRDARALVVKRDEYEEMRLVSGVDSRVGATESAQLDKPWVELLERWTGSAPLVSEWETAPLLIPTSQWPTTLYVGRDWQLFADPLLDEIEVRVEMECLPVVTGTIAHELQISAAV